MRGCEVCYVLLFRSKTGSWPGYQLFAAFNTQSIFSQVQEQPLLLCGALPDIDALLVDFTGIRWQHPGQ